MSFKSAISEVFKSANPVGVITGAVKDIVSSFRMDPEKQKEFEIKMLEAQVKAQAVQAQLEQSVTSVLLEADKEREKRIRAEVESEDSFVRRARPSWLYGLLIIYSLNYGGTTIANWFSETRLNPVDFPYEVHALTLALVGGYFVLREVGKSGKKITNLYRD